MVVVLLEEEDDDDDVGWMSRMEAEGQVSREETRVGREEPV